MTQPGGLPNVQCVVRARIPTPFGADMSLHVYKNGEDTHEHLAMVFGRSITSRSLLVGGPNETEASMMLRGASSRTPHFSRSTPAVNLAAAEASSRDESVDSDTALPLVRVHSECFTGETAWSTRCDCGDQLDTAARLICQSPSQNGVIIYLRQEGRGIGLANKLRAYNLQDQGADTAEANQQLGYPVDGRSYGIGTAILCDLGLGGERGIRLLTNNPEKVVGIQGSLGQVKVREVLPMSPSALKNGGGTLPSPELMRYLQTKIHRMGHTINL